MEYEGLHLSLELEGVKAHVARALKLNQERIQDGVQRALQDYLTPEHVQNHMDRIVEETVRSVLKEEVDRYFRYGPGRPFVHEMCEAKLNEIFGGKHE